MGKRLSACCKGTHPLSYAPGVGRPSLPSGSSSPQPDMFSRLWTSHSGRRAGWVMGWFPEARKRVVAATLAGSNFRAIAIARSRIGSGSPRTAAAALGFLRSACAGPPRSSAPSRAAAQGADQSRLPHTPARQGATPGFAPGTAARSGAQSRSPLRIHQAQPARRADDSAARRRHPTPSVH